jgi:hypothetical protein
VTNKENLRALLAEAVPLNTPCPSCLRSIEEERRGYGRAECADTALRLRIDAALAEPVVEVEHHWADYYGVLACSTCGMVKRADGRNKPCRGKTTIGLRTACVTCGDKTYRELLDDNDRVRRERDEARAEIAHLQEALKGMVNTCRLDCTAASHCGVCAIAFRALPLLEDKP